MSKVLIRGGVGAFLPRLWDAVNGRSRARAADRCLSVMWRRGEARGEILR